MNIHAICTGTVRVHERQREGSGPGVLRFLNTLLDEDWTEPLPILAWVIDHPEGVIVVDTGETARVAKPGYFPEWHPYYRLGVRFDVQPEEEIGPQLRALGIGLDDVRWVVMTHMHTDHAGGLSHFPKSEILVSRAELRAASGWLGRMRGYPNQRWPSWFAPRALDFSGHEPGLFPSSHDLTRRGDVRIVPTFGHSAGHVSVLLEEDDDTIVCFAGDASYTESHLLAGAVDGVSSMGGGTRAARETLDRLRMLTEEQEVVYLPSHDPESVARLAERRTTGTSSIDVGARHR